MGALEGSKDNRNFGNSFNKDKPRVRVEIPSKTSLEILMISSQSQWEEEEAVDNSSKNKREEKTSHLPSISILWRPLMDAKRQSSTVKQKFVELVMVLERNQGQEQQHVMPVEVQECKQLDKVQLSCRQCAEYAKEKEG